MSRLARNRVVRDQQGDPATRFTRTCWTAFLSACTNAFLSAARDRRPDCCVAARHGLTGVSTRDGTSHWIPNLHQGSRHRSSLASCGCAGNTDQEVQPLSRTLLLSNGLRHVQPTVKPRSPMSRIDYGRGSFGRPAAGYLEFDFISI